MATLRTRLARLEKAALRPAWAGGPRPAELTEADRRMLLGHGFTYVPAGPFTVPGLLATEEGRRFLGDFSEFACNGRLTLWPGAAR